jgi:hypothetical protein
MLVTEIGMQGEDDHARVRDVLARPEHAHRVGWHALAWFWTRAFWPMPWLGEAGPCRVMIVVLWGMY